MRYNVADALLAAFRRHTPPPASVELCECNHLVRQRATGGECHGLDSYGIPCQCPSVVLMHDPDDD